MKKISRNLTIAVLITLFGVTACNQKGSKSAAPIHYADPSELSKLENLFTNLSTSYNFTLNSVNESNINRTLNVFDKYSFYYTYINKTSRGEKGLFYIEDQGVQDFIVKDNNVNILFYEGPGKVEVVENYAHDDYGGQFSHLAMSSLLNVDWTHFYKIDENTYYTDDKDINRVFCLFSNCYYANWNDPIGGEESSLSYKGSKTTFTFKENGDVDILFNPKMKALNQEDYDSYYGGSKLYIKNIGSTANEAISNYMEHPNPITKKDNYGFNLVNYYSTFGDVSIPFSNKLSGYLSLNEDYSQAAVTVYDTNPDVTVIDDIKNNLTSNWIYDEEESNYWTNQMGHKVYSYHSESTLTTYVQGSPVENQIEVYYSFGISPYDNHTTIIDQTLRPNGFFVGQIYRRLGEEAITNYDDIVKYFTEIDVISYLPNFEKLKSYDLVLRDYSDNALLQEAFNEQGYYLYGYYDLTIENVTASKLYGLARNIRDDLNNCGFYSSVTLNTETYDLQAAPDNAKFLADDSYPMQIIGSALKDSDNNINAYQLLIICIDELD